MKKKLVINFLTLCFLSLLLVCQAKAQNNILNQKPQFLVEILNSYIIKNYYLLEKNTLKMAEQTIKLCNTPNPKNLKKVQLAFYKVVHTWSYVEFFRIGPVLQDNQLERFLFFPDRKKIGLAQAKKTLKEKNKKALTPKNLADMSVGIQGLGTLDFLLFDKNLANSKNDKDFWCGFIKSNAQNLNNIAKNLKSTWQNNEALRDMWLNPKDENQFFIDEKQAIKFILQTIVKGLTYIKEQRIGSFLNPKTNRQTPNQAVFRLSDATMLSIYSNLAGLKALFNDSKIEKMLKEDERRIANNIKFDFDLAMQISKQLNTPIYEILKDEKMLSEINYLKTILGFLTDRINDELLPSLGISKTIVFGDGD